MDSSPNVRVAQGSQPSPADRAQARSSSATRPARTPDVAQRDHPACIWAIGSGKGGVGKSVLTSSLAISLTQRGQRCAVIDADLGGANVHTLLGVAKPERTLTDFLGQNGANLSELMCETPIENLWLISGAQALHEMANLKHFQKQKMLRQIRSLDVDHIFLDLSAGSAFNVLDFFLAAERRLLVVVPEPTSIENAYHFLKAAFFRSLRIAARSPRVRSALDQVLRDSPTCRAGSPRDLIDAVTKLDRCAGEELRNRAIAFAPMLLLNQARSLDDERVGHDISIACREYLGTPVDYLGALERDECVHDSVRNRRPVLQTFPDCRFAQDLELITARLLDRASWESHTGLEPLAGRHDLFHRQLPPEPLATSGLFSDAPPEPEPARRESAEASRASRRWTAKLPPLDLANPGAYLRRCRVHLSLRLRELARETRIRCLEEIENERFGELPAMPYVRGYVVQYAQLLGIREADALASSFLDRRRMATQV